MRHGMDKFNYIQPNKSNENKIPAKEPVFLIRGQDKLGPQTLRAYANQYELMGGSPVILANIRAHAFQMEAWQAKTGISKIAD